MYATSSKAAPTFSRWDLAMKGSKCSVLQKCSQLGGRGAMQPSQFLRDVIQGPISMDARVAEQRLYLVIR